MNVKPRHRNTHCPGIDNCLDFLNFDGVKKKYKFFQVKGIFKYF
jgi:hypothetical protein